MTAALFDPPPAPSGAVHAHTSPVCTFCENASGVQAQQAGQSAVTRDEWWWNETAEWLASLPSGQWFTADDLVAACGLPTGSSNQVGARINGWARSGLIVACGYVKAARRASHSRVLAVWEVTR